MTLLETASTLTTRLDLRTARNLREQEAATLRARTTPLTSLLARLEAAQNKALTLQANGLKMPGMIRPTALALLSKYFPDGSGVQAPPNFSQETWEDLKASLDGFTIACEAAVRSTITCTKTECIAGATEQELQGYLSDPTTKATAGDLLNKLSGMKCSAWESLAPAILDSELKRGAAFRVAVLKLRSEGASAAARDFMALARSPGGAPLDALTDILRTELTTRNMISQVRLKVLGA